MSTLRLFIAVPCAPSPGLRKMLASLAEHRDVLKPVSPEQLHVTLRFLGEQPASRVSALAEAMQQAVGAVSVRAMALPFAGLMTLPPGRKPARTVCVGLADDEPCHVLHDALLEALAALDPSLARMTRRYRPHLTLARVKGPARKPNPAAVSVVNNLLASHAQTDLGQFVGEAVHLIASELTPLGPVHRTLHHIALPPA